MYWHDEGYLLSKNNFDENSIIIEVFTLNHGKYNGIVYGGSSRKKKKIIQIGNKFLLNWKTKNENRIGYFDIELINPVAPLFFDDKKRSICILAATSILKTLLPERQVNKKIYATFDYLLKNLELNNWIFLYISWELSLIKELGFELNFDHNRFLINNNFLELNGKNFKVPSFLFNQKETIKLNRKLNRNEIKEALIFNKNIFLENFITPNRLRFPLSRNLLEKYF
jgi:DNA repair protein RecO (recombination protein O)